MTEAFYLCVFSWIGFHIVVSSPWFNTDYNAFLVIPFSSWVVYYKSNILMRWQWFKIRNYMFQILMGLDFFFVCNHPFSINCEIKCTYLVELQVPRCIKLPSLYQKYQKSFCIMSTVRPLIFLGTVSLLLASP